MKRYTTLTLAGLLMLGWGQALKLANHEDPASGMLQMGLGLAAVAVALWGWHLWGEPARVQEDLPAAPDPPRGWPGLRRPNVVLLTLSVLGTVVVGLLATREPFVPAYVLLFGLWITSIEFFLLGTLQRGELEARWEASKARLDEEAPALIVVGVATLIALLARSIALRDYPYLFSFDEGAFAQEAAALADGKFYGNPFGPAWLSHPRLFNFWMALFVNALGRTIPAARLAVAIPAALTVPAVYALTRQLFGNRAGLAAALFIAGFNFHVHFSRLALNNAIDPMLGAAAFAFLLTGLRSGRLSDYGLAGVLLGLSQYFYAGARLLPIIMAVWLGWSFLLDEDDLRAGWQRAAAGMGVLLLGALVVTWPANWTLITGGEPLTTRIGSTGLFATGYLETLLQTQGPLEIAWSQIRNSSLALIQTLDTNQFYGPVAPMMGRYAGIALLMGIIFAVARSLWMKGLARAAVWLPLLWIAATMLAGGALLIDPPHYARYVLLTPAAAALVGLAAAQSAYLLGESGWFLKGWPVLVGVGLLVVELAFYTGVYLPHPHNYGYGPQALMVQEMVRQVDAEYEDNPAIQLHYLTAPNYFLNNSTLILYFAPDVYDVEHVQPVTALPEEVSPLAESLFIVTPARRDELDPIIDGLPGGILTQHLDENEALLYWTYRHRLGDTATVTRRVQIHDTPQSIMPAR